MATYDGGRFGGGRPPKALDKLPKKGTGEAQPSSTPTSAPRTDRSTEPSFDPSNPQLIRFQKALLVPKASVGEQQRRQQAEAELLGGGALGDPEMDAATFINLAPLSAASHILLLLGQERGRIPRPELIQKASDLVIALDDPTRVTRLFQELRQGGGIVDLHLDLMASVVRGAKHLLPKVVAGGIVKNMEALAGPGAEPEAGRMTVSKKTGELITLDLPLGLKLTGFSLGGGSPGFALVPGPLKSHLLEFWGPGSFDIHLFGETKGMGYLDDKLRMKIVGAPEDG